MIAFFSSCIHNYHLCMPEENKRYQDEKTKKESRQAAQKEDIKQKKLYFCYYNSQSASAAVLSFKLPTTTTYYSYYFTREIEHKSEVLSTATANIKNFARNNTTMVESEDIKHSHLAFF